MSAYIIFFRERLLDQAELDKYWVLASEAMQGHSAELITAYGKQESLEGESPEGVVILKFSTLGEARSWYYSPLYQKASLHRKKGAEWRVILTEGHQGEFQKPLT